MPNTWCIEGNRYVLLFSQELCFLFSLHLWLSNAWCTEGNRYVLLFSQELYFLFSLHLWLSFKRMLKASWFAIILAEIRTRWILREKADCKQSTIDYIGCDFGIQFWARMTKAKFACNRIFIPPIPSPRGLLICGRIKVVFSEKFVVSFIC